MQVIQRTEDGERLIHSQGNHRDGGALVWDSICGTPGCVKSFRCDRAPDEIMRRDSAWSRQAGVGIKQDPASTKLNRREMSWNSNPICTSISPFHSTWAEP